MPMQEESDYLSLNTSDIAAVPFMVADQGYTKAAGLVRLEPKHLVIEFEVLKKNLDHVMHWLGQVFGNDEKRNKANIFTVEIPLQDLEGITVKRGFYSAKEGIYRNAIFVRTKKLIHLKDLPTSQGGVVRLIVPKEHKKDAAALVSRAMFNRSELLVSNL
jgi:hypothetical protein